MSAHYEVFKDSAGEYRWRFKGANGEIMATSEAYTERHNARRAITDFEKARMPPIIWVGMPNAGESDEHHHPTG